MLHFSNFLFVFFKITLQVETSCSSSSPSGTSNSVPAMNYVPGPSSQQPRPESHLAANAIPFFPPPNQHQYPQPNPFPHPNSPPNPTYVNPAMPPIPTSSPNPNMFPNQHSFQPNPNTSPNQNMVPNPNNFPNPNVTPIPNVVPNPNVSSNQNVPNPNIPPNPSMSPNPTVTHSPVMNPDSRVSPNPTKCIVPLNANTSPDSSVAVNPNVSPNSNLSPKSSVSPNQDASPKPSVLPNKDASPDSTPSPAKQQPTQPSPPIQPTPSTSTLPNPNLSLAGKLAENIRRSKRQKNNPNPDYTGESSEPAQKKSKTLPAKIEYDDDDDDDEESECPKEYLIENAYTDRLRFNNHVAKTVYKKDFSRFTSKDEFQKYLTAQQKWRWEVNNIVVTLDTRVHNLCVNQNAGIAQNVKRYSSVPLNCKSDDVRRCEKTAKELEKMIFRIEQTKEDMIVRRKLLFDDDRECNPGEVDFMDKVLEKVNILKTSVETFHSNVSETLQNICRRFTTESVEAAEIRRQKRRKKENLKKKRKSQERQLEKKVIDTLLRLTTKEVAERILTGSDAAKITEAEINSKELTNMTKGTNESELLSLHTILVREYLDEAAAKLVKNKLAKCC